MRIPVQSIAGGWLAGVSALLGAVLDVALFTVFRAHIRQAFAVERYRPVYLRSGRRNRIRF